MAICMVPLFVPIVFPLVGRNWCRRRRTGQTVVQVTPWPNTMGIRSRYIHVYNGQVLVGELPGDFLRVEVNREQRQISADEQAALALQHQLAGAAFRSAQAVGRLTISVVEARLVKNYGMTRMDPYVRVRIGHNVYETHTDYNGARNPHWNKMFHCFLSQGVTFFVIEIFDECAFTANEKIAWAQIVVPESVFSGETSNTWHPLSGRQGEGKEGEINIIMSYQPMPPGSLATATPQMVVVNSPYVMPGVVQYPAPAGYMYPAYGMPMVQPPPIVQPQQPVINPVLAQPPPHVNIPEEDVKQVCEMFPEMGADVVRGVLETHRGNKDAAVNALLFMNTTA